jgi:hypothetical protein
MAVANRAMVGLALGWILIAGAGCGGAGGTVTFRSQETGRIVQQRFSHAFYAVSTSGDVDVVLVQNSAEDEMPRTRGKKPIEPLKIEPVRQVMHIRLYWNAVTGTTRNPAAINSTVDWTVLGPEGTADRSTYVGAAYVVLRGRGESRTVYIRDGEMKIRSKAGDIQDPVGPSWISGTLNASASAIRVRELLAEAGSANELKTEAR